MAKTVPKIVNRAGTLNKHIRVRTLTFLFCLFCFVLLEGRTNFYDGASKDIAPPPKDIHGHEHEYPSYHDVIVVNKQTPNS